VGLGELQAQLRVLRLEADGLLLVSQPLGPGHGRGPGRGWRRGHRPGPGAPPAFECLILALDPAAATPVAARAGVTLLLSGVAAALLLGVALVFWRASRRAELLAAELARDKQLKLLGEMSAVLGHELRNPLASLKGHAQLLLEKISTEHAARSGAERVVSEAKRLERLTGEVLEFARTAQLDLVPTDPLAVARASASAVEDARVELVVESPPATCRLDAHRMQQVLENVLRNALQASAADGRVTLRVAGSPDGALFSVRDRGTGIAGSDIERIFEPFVTGKTRGTGLGLAVAKRIVEGHGGTIAARNHPGGGVEITIALPVALAGSGG
jgi:two-component system sensor histidine kinase HydH